MKWVLVFLVCSGYRQQCGWEEGLIFKNEEACLRALHGSATGIRTGEDFLLARCIEKRPS